jgi:hypothetical protein
VFDLGAMMVAATAASPIAWEHHHAILFPLFAVIAATPRAYRWAIPLAAAYALTANSWAPLNALAGIPLLNGLQSVPLAGVLIVFLLLGRLSGKPGATMPGPSGLPEQELIVCTATPASRLP